MASEPSSRWGPRLALVAATAFFGVVAYLLLWTTLMVYDDEGYVLYSLRMFAQHGHLYGDVFTQYGPFFYVALSPLRALGLEFTNTAGRELALVCWIGSAALCARIVWWRSGHRFLPTLITLAGVFAHLWPMTSEPSHPGGFIALAAAVVAYAGARPRWSSATRAVIVGAVASMVLLTKVNVGVFLVTSAGLWWLLHLPVLHARRAGRWCAGLAAAALPLLLMRGSFNAGWVQVFALVAAAGILAVAVAFEPDPTDRSRGRDLAFGAGAGLVIAAVTFVVVLTRGTTMSELLDGIILGPLRHPGVYSFGFDWRPGSIALAVIAVPGALWVSTLAPARRAVPVLLARCVVAAGYLAVTSGLLPITSAGFALSFGVSTAWLFVIRVGDRDANQGTRAWLAMLLVLQALHAYPVAGSQVSWGTFLFVPLVVLGIVDAAAAIPSAVVRRTAATLVMGYVAFLSGEYAFVGWTRYVGSTPLRFPGAENIRMPEEVADALQIIVRNADLHGDLLFTLPGMMSFHTWTGLPPPTISNVTHWFSLLKPGQQEQIRARLEASPRSVLIVQRANLDLLAKGGIPVRSPLVQWLYDHYEPVLRLQTYELWVRKGRSIATIGTAQLYQVEKGTPARYQLVVTALLPAAAKIASVEIRQFEGDTSRRLLAWDNANAKFLATSVDREGKPRQDPVAEALPFAAQGLMRLQVLSDQMPGSLDTHQAVVYLRDAEGRIVEVARFSD